MVVPHLTNFRDALDPVAHDPLDAVEGPAQPVPDQSGARPAVGEGDMVNAAEHLENVKAGRPSALRFEL